MEIINNFKKKGGKILWIDGLGVQATWCGESKRFIRDIKTKEVYRATDKEWESPPENMVRIKAFYG